MFTNQHLAEREQWSDQVAENSARHAFSWGTVTTTGWGEVRIADAIRFDVTFVKQPTVSHGYAIDDDEKLVDGFFPRACGGVRRWIQDERDLYIGAYVFVSIDAGTEVFAKMLADSFNASGGSTVNLNPYADAPDYELEHTFLFAGTAMKDAGT